MECAVELQPVPGKCFLIHSINSSSSLHGFRALVVPPNIQVPPEYGVAAKSVTNTYVYLQTANPFTLFSKFCDAEREQSLVLLKNDYIDLLNYWRETFPDLKTRLFKEAAVLKNYKDGVQLTQYLQFVGQGACCLTTDINSKLRLTAWIENTGLDVPGSEICLYVKLIKDAKRFYLPAETFNELVSCQDTYRYLSNFFSKLPHGSKNSSEGCAQTPDPEHHLSPPPSKKSKSPSRKSK